MRPELPVSPQSETSGPVLHLESQRGSETRRYLLDFGLTPEAYINNLESKDDPAAGDALILSHRHYDHMRGPVLCTTGEW